MKTQNSYPNEVSPEEVLPKQTSTKHIPSKEPLDESRYKDEINASGELLPPNWVTTVAIIWCGQAASVFATCAASFAAVWFITESTASPIWLSLATASALLPAALLSPFGGVVADRFNRKHVMILADGCAGLFSLILAIVILSGFLIVPLMLLLLAVRAGAQAFHGPALTALLPHLVPERHLMRINSMDQAITSLSSIAGPVLGIFLYTFIGLQGVMILDASCAAIACACLAYAKIPGCKPAVLEHNSVLADLKEGTSFILQDKGLRNLMLLIMFTMLLFMPASSLSPLMTYEHFHGNGWQASLIEAVFGIGLLVGSVAIMVWGGGKKHVPIIILSGIVLGLSLAGCGLLQSDQFVVFALLIGIAAAALGCYNAPMLPIIQKRTPDEKLGRVMGIFLTGSSLAAPIGLMFSGFIAEEIGITNWFIVCGLLVALCCALGWFSRSIRNLDTKENTQSELNS